MALIPSPTRKWSPATFDDSAKLENVDEIRRLLVAKVQKLKSETFQVDQSLREQLDKARGLQCELGKEEERGQALHKKRRDLEISVRTLKCETDRRDARCGRLQREVKLKSTEVESAWQSTASEAALLEEVTQQVAEVREGLQSVKESHRKGHGEADIAYRCLKEDVWSVQKMLNARKSEKDAVDRQTTQVRESLQMEASERERLEYEIRARARDFHERQRRNRDVAARLKQTKLEMGAMKTAVEKRTGDVYSLHTSTRHSNADSFRLKAVALKKAHESGALRSEVLSALRNIQERQYALQEQMSALKLGPRSESYSGSGTSGGAPGDFHCELVAVRTTPTGPAGLENVPRCFEVARLDPNSPGQIGICDSLGIFRLGSLSVEERRIAIQASFYLQHWDGGQLRNIPQIPWLGFDFLSARPGEILFSRSGGNQLLFFKLPLDANQPMSQIFLFGVHGAPVSSFLVNASGVLVVSGSQDGAIKLWDVTSGDLLDHSPNAHSCTPTCMHFMGPFMVVIGWSDGLFGLWDIASSRLIHTNKISMGHHSISCISAFVPDDILSRVSTARGLSRPSTGGGILSGVPRLPGRQYSNREDPKAPRFPGSRSTMIVVGCEDGTVTVWAPSQSNSQWEICFTVPRREHHIPTKLAFAPCGNLLQIVSGVGDTSMVFSHDTTSGEMLSGHSTHGIPILCEFINQSPNLSSGHPLGPCPAQPTSKTVMLALLKFGTPSVMIFPLASLDRDQHGHNARGSALTQCRDSDADLGIGGAESRQDGEMHTVSLRAGLEDRIMRIEGLSLEDTDDAGIGFQPRATDHSSEEGHSGSDDEDRVVPEPRITPATLIPIPQSSIKEVSCMNPKTTVNTTEVAPWPSDSHAHAATHEAASYGSTWTSRPQETPCPTIHPFPSSKVNAKIISHPALPALDSQRVGVVEGYSSAVQDRMPRSCPMEEPQVKRHHLESSEQAFPPMGKLLRVPPEFQAPSQSISSEQDLDTRSEPRWKVQRHKNSASSCGDASAQMLYQKACVVDGRESEPRSEIQRSSSMTSSGNRQRKSQLSGGCSSSSSLRNDGENVVESTISTWKMNQERIIESFGNEGNDENRPPIGNGSTFGVEVKGDFSKPELQSTNVAAKKLEQCRNEEFDSDRMLGQDSVKKRIIERAAKGGNVPRNAKIFDELKPIGPEVAPQVKRMVRKQLHPKWVAGRSRKPQISDLWNPEDHQVEICDTAPVHVPVKFSLRGLAKSLSRIPLEVKQKNHVSRDRQQNT